MPTVAPAAAKTSTTPTSGPVFSQEDTDDMNWLFAWILVIVVGSLITKTDIGYKIVYYSLLLLVVFLVLSQYKWIAKELGYATFDLPYNTGTDNKGSSTTTTKTTLAYTPGAYGPGGMIPL